MWIIGISRQLDGLVRLRARCGGSIPNVVKENMLECDDEGGGFLLVYVFKWQI